MSGDNTDFLFLSTIGNQIRKEIDSDFSDWKDSPLFWVKSLPPGTKGKFGIRLISAWCAANGLLISTSPDPESDLLINGHRAEIKFSTLWKSGVYTFQQIRDQNYEYLIALGISPLDARCWVITKDVLYQNVIGHKPQHTGATGTETFWFKVKPDDPPDWLQDLGGTLEDALKILRLISKK